MVRAGASFADGAEGGPGEGLCRGGSHRRCGGHRRRPQDLHPGGSGLRTSGGPEQSAHGGHHQAVTLRDVEIAERRGLPHQAAGPRPCGCPDGGVTAYVAPHLIPDGATPRQRGRRVQRRGGPGQRHRRGDVLRPGAPGSCPRLPPCVADVMEALADPAPPGGDRLGARTRRASWTRRSWRAAGTSASTPPRSRCVPRLRPGRKSSARTAGDRLPHRLHQRRRGREAGRRPARAWPVCGCWD